MRILVSIELLQFIISAISIIYISGNSPNSSHITAAYISNLANFLDQESHSFSLRRRNYGDDATRNRGEHYRSLDETLANPDINRDPCDSSDPMIRDQNGCDRYSFPPTGSPTYNHVSADFSQSDVTILMASNGYRDAHFGHAVSLQKHIAAIGSYAEGQLGSAYIYTVSNTLPDGTGDIKWTETARLTSPDTTNDYFGYSIALNNNTLYIGAYKSDATASSSGAVYVFNPSHSRPSSNTPAYKQTHLLSAFDSLENEYFGYSISSSGVYTAVGAIGNSDKAQNAGVVYIFRLLPGETKYTQFARLYSSDPVPHHSFGAAVSIRNGFLIVGAVGDQEHDDGLGSAYIYKYDWASNQWLEESRLSSPEGRDAQDYYGYSVDIHGEVAVVGAYLGEGYRSAINANPGGVGGTGYIPGGGVDSGDRQTGTVYVYQRRAKAANGNNVADIYNNNDDYAQRMRERQTHVTYYWTLIQTLYPTDEPTPGYFGYSIALYGKVLVVGSPGDNTQSDAAGAAYVYEETWPGRWQFTYKMYGQPEALDLFGCAVSVYERMAVVGAVLGDGLETDTGAAYAYTPPDEFSVRYGQRRQRGGGSSYVQYLLHIVETKVIRVGPLVLVGVTALMAVSIVLIYFTVESLCRDCLSKSNEGYGSSHGISGSGRGGGGSASAKKPKKGVATVRSAASSHRKKTMKLLPSDSCHRDENELADTAIDVSSRSSGAGGSSVEGGEVVGERKDNARDFGSGDLSFTRVSVSRSTSSSRLVMDTSGRSSSSNLSETLEEDTEGPGTYAIDTEKGPVLLAAPSQKRESGKDKVKKKKIDGSRGGVVAPSLAIVPL